MTLSYVLEIGIGDIFSFSIAKPADVVPFHQAYMYQHQNAHISAHIQNKPLLCVFIFLGHKELCGAHFILICLFRVFGCKH